MPNPAQKKPAVVRTVAALRRKRDQWKRDTVALVPTMGALHSGHLALVKLARKKAKRVVVSIFVNPTQFAPNEDFGSYPRTWQADLKALAAMKVDLVWSPTPEAMYPEGFSTKIAPGGPALAGLEDKFRPHFFGGVTTVVSKLFLQVAPDFAIFGEKDFQQLAVGKTVHAFFQVYVLSETHGTTPLVFFHAKNAKTRTAQYSRFATNKAKDFPSNSTSIASLKMSFILVP